MEHSKKRKRKDPPEGASKNTKDMPRRPLSAYNLFFKHKRRQLIDSQNTAAAHASGSKPEACSDDVANASVDATPQEAADSHKAGIGDEGKKKRKHVRTSGLGFTNLTKIVATEWKALDPTTRAFYEEEAAKDKQRYREEMEKYRAKMEAEEAAMTAAQGSTGAASVAKLPSSTAVQTTTTFPVVQRSYSNTRQRGVAQPHMKEQFWQQAHREARIISTESARLPRYHQGASQAGALDSHPSQEQFPLTGRQPELSSHIGAPALKRAEPHGMEVSRQTGKGLLHDPRQHATQLAALHDYKEDTLQYRTEHVASDPRFGSSTSEANPSPIGGSVAVAGIDPDTTSNDDGQRLDDSKTGEYGSSIESLHSQLDDDEVDYLTKWGKMK